MTVRRCEWCGIPILHKGVACTDAHRAKRWRWLSWRKTGGRPVEAPPPGSPLLSGERVPETALNGSSSGLQVSYVKALGRLVADLGPFVETYRIEMSLRSALPERQRKRLEAR